MAVFSYKILGQVFPADTSETVLYTVPAGTQTITSLLLICNQSADVQTFSVAIRKGGATLEDKQYIYRDAELQSKDTLDLTAALTLFDGDIISVICSNGDALSFSLFGTEYS